MYGFFSPGRLPFAPWTKSWNSASSAAWTVKTGQWPPHSGARGAGRLRARLDRVWEAVTADAAVPCDDALGHGLTHPAPRFRWSSRTVDSPDGKYWKR